MRAPALAVVFAVAALAGCRGGDAIHELDPSLSRMMRQPRVDPFMPSEVFSDGAGTRPAVPGTVPMGDREDRGLLPNGHYRTDIPRKVDRPFVELGRRRFEALCAACHGVAGDGVTVVAEKFSLRPPPDLTEPRILELAPGAIYEVIRGGYGLMGPYASDLEPDERWAVVAYVKALQLSRHADVKKLPADVRAELEKEAP